MPFKKIGLAITFSPNSIALLKNAKRLAKLLNAELNLIHVGAKTPELEKSLNQFIIQAGLGEFSQNVFWENDDPADVILKFAEDQKIDLLLAGALEKETIIKYYIGSVARKIMREAPCSVLILVSPSAESVPFRKICVTTDFSYPAEISVKKAYELAKLENAKEFIILREFETPGLAITVADSGSAEETEQVRLDWQKEEEEKMKMFVRELNLKGPNIKTACLYGKPGWEVNKYIKSSGGDLLVIRAPEKKLTFFDRLFPHDQEFLFKELPCSLLILREMGK
ncbi:MAG: universal stress protein [bacterium]